MTTLFGLGQGLFLALYTGQVYSLFKLLPPQDGPLFYGIGSGLVLGLLIVGLIASVFHLGHPKKALGALTQWRTSWLSREAILLPVLLFLVFLYGGLHLLNWKPVLFSIGEGVQIDLTLMIGGVATLVCFGLYLATAMIYASLRLLQEWATPLTVINFLLLGGASGFTLATTFAMTSAPQLVEFYGTWAIVITLTGFCSRGISLYRNSQLRYQSKLQSAIGIRHDQIRQLHQGAMGGNFNTKEFFHGREAELLQQIQWGFLILGFILPILLLTVGLVMETIELLTAAVLIQYTGLLLERWFFFADSKHPQNLYYRATNQHC